MSSPNVIDLWTRFLSDELSDADEAQLVSALRMHTTLRDKALSDAEMDGLLRSLGKASQGDEEERFVASVLAQLGTEGVVAAPPVIQSPETLPVEDLPIADAIDVAPPPIVNHPQQSNITPAKTPGTAPRFDSRIAWSVVAGLAASLLIALMVFNGGDTDDALTGSDSEPSLRIGTEQLDEYEASQPTLAESEPQIDSRPEEPPGEVEKLAAIHDPTELVEKAPQPKQIRKADPERSPTEPTKPPMSGFAVLTSSSEDAKWYQTPREQTGQSLNLQSGTADFRLASGTTISVSGPSHFQIDSPNSLILAAGVVSADVPTEAIGFAIDTPSARVVDLGTQFDMRVSPNGAMLVHVGKGSVAVEAAADESSRIIIQEDDRKFIETDGTFWDWKVEITADIFGDLSGMINDQSFQANSLSTLQAFAREIFADQAITRTRSDRPMRARYVFNGRLQDSDDLVPDGELLQSIKRDLSLFKDVVRRAVDDSGSYRVKDRIYVYGNLKEKLQARRTIARIHGPRVLGTRFLPHEEFETTGDADELYELQSELNKRLDFDFAAESLLPNSKRSKTAARRIEVRQPQTQDAGKTATVVQPNGDDSSGQFQGTVSQRAAEHEEAFRRLEEIRRRKERLQPAVPANGAAEDDAPETESVAPTAEATSVEKDAVIARTVPKRKAAKRTNPELDATVVAALEAELQGNQDKRNELLNQTLVNYDGHPAANWQLGRVKVAGEWLPVQQAQERGKSSPVVASFKRMRAAHEGSIEGELKLARWSKSRRPEASRMYYTRLLNNPTVTNAAVRTEAAENLDLVPYGGSYLTKTELKQQQERQETWRNAHRRWNKPLAKWVKWLRPQTSSEQKQRAIEEMEQVDDPGLVLAANQFVTQGGDVFGVELVHAVDKYLQPESSHLLCNIAMNNGWPDVRLAAVTALKERKLHDYVPDLLGSLVGPVHSGWRIVRQSDGTIRYEHMVRREGATSNRELLTVREAMPVTRIAPQFDGMPSFAEILGRPNAVSDAATRERRSANVSLRPLEPVNAAALPANVPLGQLVPVGRGGSRLRGLDRLWVQRRWTSRDTGQDTAISKAMAESAAQQEQRVALANDRGNAYNDQIFKLLSATTEQELPPDAPQWWNWWTGYNEIELEKPTQRDYDYDEIQFVNRTIGIGSRVLIERHSCFAAGTPVATETGMRSIEEIVAGDRVFAKNLETGELRLQTVLATTIRSAPTTLELTIDGSTLRTTVGHPFWVAGEGWRMAKLLKEGDQLHGVSGGSVVEQIRTLPGAQVFNLVVDQFNNYFVGEAMTLAHDNTFRTPAPVRLPGLK